MGVQVCLPLFGPAGRELEDVKLIQGKHLRDLGEEMQKRLAQAGELLDSLLAAGWNAQPSMYDVLLTCKGVETREEAEKRLQELEISLEVLMIFEDVEEDEGE